MRSRHAKWSRVTAPVPWLAETLKELRIRRRLARVRSRLTALKRRCVRISEIGVRWLHLLSTLGLGACLADDMGLGKTMQVLALLLVLQRDTGS